MPALVFLVSITMTPIFIGLATSPRWSLLGLFVPFIWYFSPGRMTWGHVLGLVLLAWCAVSLLWAFDRDLGIYDFGKMAMLGLLFCIGAARRDLNAIYIAAALGAAVNSVIVIGQYFWGWSFLPQGIIPGGTFYNKNFVAEFVAMAAVGVLSVPRWRWLALGTLPALVLCGSRTALLALGAAFILLIWQYYRPAALALGAVLMAIGVHVMNTSDTFIQRLQLWQDTMAGATFFGHGVGSFWSVYPEYATRIDALSLRPSEAHNDLLQVFFELGAPGALVLIALLVFAWQGPKRVEHYVLAVFLVEGLAGFPLHLPVTAMLAALVLGRLCGDRPELCGAGYWGRVGHLLGEDQGADGRRVARLP